MRVANLSWIAFLGWIAMLGFLALMIGGAIAILVLISVLRYRLRTRHQPEWLVLLLASRPAGTAPHVVTHLEVGILWAWVWRRGYLGLDDPVTVRVAAALRFIYLVVFAMAVIAIVLGTLAQLLPPDASH